MDKYTIGVDFGTLSGRAVLVNVDTGEEVDYSVYEYPHGVMDESLPSGRELPHDWALQHPQDYLDVLKNTIPELLCKTKISPDEVIGLGIDFTACSVMPVKRDGTPLCFLDKYMDNPHAYVKLWKHHAAQDLANELNSKALEMGEEWIKRYGGKISSEWLFPKLWQILKEDPEVYDDMDAFIEAGDWIVWQLTGKEIRNSCAAGYKAIWHKKCGYPSKKFFKSLDERLENVVEEKLSGNIVSIGQKAGEITEYAAKLTGLNVGTAVAVPTIDAHVFAPAVKIYEPRKMLAIIGTSTCHIVLSNEEVNVPGICGVVEDGVIPGCFGYEAGQPCVGDSFAWFVENCVPAKYVKEAEMEGIDIYEYLEKKAELLKVGESGLLALDWWNGNRSVLVDVDLTGLIIGMNLQTKPEEIYRALLESTAFGTKMIVDTFEENGVAIDEFYASGGIPQRNSLMMQIYADVLDIPVRIAGTDQGGGLGSAIFGAVAAGKECGGYDSVVEASKVMGKVKDIVYMPIEENVEIYEKIYKEYKKLHDYFGCGNNNCMKVLKQMRVKA